MILVTGGTGHLGAALIPRLVATGNRVRVLARDPERAHRRLGSSAEIIEGDVRNPDSLKAAVNGVDAVASAMTGFGLGGVGPRAVDHIGNLNLIRAAEAAGIRRFVLISMHGAGAHHPMELLRMKHRAEELLTASRLNWTIVRPTVFMELWISIVGDPIMKTGKTTVFGRGDNPVNFISVRDVARVVELALLESGLGRQALDVGGPENMSFNQLVERIQSESGRSAAVRHLPLPLMRLSSLLLRPMRPDVAGMIQAGIMLDTTDMTFDAGALQRQLPQHRLTFLGDVLGSMFGAARKDPAVEPRPGLDTYSQAPE